MPRKPCKHVTYWCMQRSSYWGAASTRQKCYTYSKSAKMFLVFLALIASLCDMPDAALADCSGCPVAREAVQSRSTAKLAKRAKGAIFVGRYCYAVTARSTQMRNVSCLCVSQRRYLRDPTTGLAGRWAKRRACPPQLTCVEACAEACVEASCNSVPRPRAPALPRPTLAPTPAAARAATRGVAARQVQAGRRRRRVRPGGACLCGGTR